jgi:hypothetical protein
VSLKAKFAKKIQDKIDLHSDKVLDGQCVDMVNYARTCGVMYGLKMALSEFGDAVEEINNEGNETE